MRLDLLLLALLFVLIGLMLVSFFLVWHWFDAKEQLAIARAHSREETIGAIKRGHNKCRLLLCISLLLALAYVVIPFTLRDYYNTLVYPAVVVAVDIIILIILRVKRNEYIGDIDEAIATNEEHVREAAEEKRRVREQWLKEAPQLNKIAQQQIQQIFGDAGYETWFEHDILLSRNVLANTEQGILYAQGVALSFSDIREVRRGRKDLKLVTGNSMHPFVTIDFGMLPINPETGNKYQDEIAAKIEELRN